MQFIDSKNRTISLEFNDEGHIEAMYGTEIIGMFEFRTDEDELPEIWELWHMQVEPPYQKCGIGSKMMKFAVEQLAWFILPKPSYFINAPNYLTDEGAALVNHCFKTGVLPSSFRTQYEQR